MPNPVYRIVLWNLEYHAFQEEPSKSLADIVELDSMPVEGETRVEPTLDYLREFALDRRCTMFGHLVAGCDDDPEEIELAYQRACEVVVIKVPRDFGTGGSLKGAEEVLRIPEKREEPESDDNEPSPEEAFAILASVKLQPFEEIDWNMYAGCVSENPLIGETDDEKWDVVVDGDVLALHEIREGGSGREFQFQLTRRL